MKHEESYEEAIQSRAEEVESLRNRLAELETSDVASNKLAKAQTEVINHFFINIISSSYFIIIILFCIIARLDLFYVSMKIIFINYRIYCVIAGLSYYNN